MRRAASTIVLALLGLAGATVSADPSAKNPLARKSPPDATDGGTANQIVALVPGIGDGQVTRADVDAICDYTVWGFNLMLEDAGETTRLDAKAHSRIAGFFGEAWPWLGPDAQAFIANASRTVPAARARASGTDADETMDVFLEFSDGVWGGAEDAAVAYFAGAMDDATFASIWGATRGVGTGGMSGDAFTAAPDGYGSTGSTPGGTFEDMAGQFGYTPPPVQYDGDVIVDEGSGTVISGDE